MRAIEFQTVLGKDGIIKLPADFSEEINGGKVRVIILVEDKKPLSREEIYDRKKDRAASFIKFLIKNPLKVDKSTPFLKRDEIHDRNL